MLRNLTFMCKGSQPRICADLPRLQSRVKGPYGPFNRSYKTKDKGLISDSANMTKQHA